MVDRRDTQTWIALELTRLGEQKIEEGTLADSLRRDLSVGSEFPIFIPSTTYVKAGKRITIHLMEGYCFVASGLPETRYFSLEKLPYINSVMSVIGGPHRMRALSVLPNREIERLQRMLAEQLAADIEVNSWVKVVNGKFKGLEGRVLQMVGVEHAYVQFELRSLHRVSPIPRVFLETMDPQEATG